MALFSKGSAEANFLGIDIGGSSIKLVELTNNNGKAQLVTYGYLERSLSANAAKLIDQPDKTAELLKKISAKSRTVTKRAVTALPTPAVFSSIISLPELTRKDLASTKKITLAVELEAKKVLPLPLEEMILDWKIISDQIKLQPAEGTEKIKNIQVLLTGAAKDVVEKYIEIFKKADLELISLETEPFALARAMVGKDPSSILLVDIGAGGTDLSVIENGVPVLNRSVGVGGLEITKAIAETLKITMEQAEQFKRDLENSPEQANGQMPPAILRTIDSILNEIQYTINFYLSEPANADKSFDRIVLSGGTANLYNLPKYISEKSGLRVFIGNPWARVIYPADLQPILTELGPRLATSIGLAMRDIE